MPIKLINPKRRREVKIEGSTFYVTPILAIELNQIVFSHTNAGKTDWVGVVNEALKKHLVGWKNVMDDDGKEIDFDPELVPRLPTMVQNRIYEEIVKDTQRVYEAEKNSTGGQG